MKLIQSICILLLFLLCTFALGQQEQAVTNIDNTKLSERQHYRVTFTSKLDPIVINTIHAWIIQIENKTGEPVLNADINVAGGMPEHNHGLPTRPQVTKNLGDGCYLLEGLKFHMSGWWQITIAILDNEISDTVTFDLQLQN